MSKSYAKQPDGDYKLGGRLQANPEPWQDLAHDLAHHIPPPDLSADGKITAASVKAAATPNGQSQQVEIFELVDAFNTPRLILDPVQRKLLVDTQPKNIHATAEVGLQREVSHTALCCSCHVLQAPPPSLGPSLRAPTHQASSTL